METKYSIAMSSNGENSYSLIISSFQLDAEGLRINEVNQVLTGKTLEECKTLIAAI